MDRPQYTLATADRYGACAAVEDIQRPFEQHLMNVRTMTHIRAFHSKARGITSTAYIDSENDHWVGCEADGVLRVASVTAHVATDKEPGKIGGNESVADIGDPSRVGIVSRKRGLEAIAMDSGERTPLLPDALTVKRVGPDRSVLIVDRAQRLWFLPNGAASADNRVLLASGVNGVMSCVRVANRLVVADGKGTLTMYDAQSGSVLGSRADVWTYSIAHNSQTDRMLCMGSPSGVLGEPRIFTLSSDLCDLTPVRCKFPTQEEFVRGEWADGGQMAVLGNGYVADTTDWRLRPLLRFA